MPVRGWPIGLPVEASQSRTVPMRPAEAIVLAVGAERHAVDGTGVAGQGLADRLKVVCPRRGVDTGSLELFVSLVHSECERIALTAQRPLHAVKGPSVLTAVETGSS